MNTTNPTSGQASFAQAQTQTTTRPARGSANRNASSSSSAGQAPFFHTRTDAPNEVDAPDWAPKPLARDYANTLNALTGWLNTLNDPANTLHADDVINLFDALKAAEKDGTLPSIIRDYPTAPALPRFVKALTAFLARLDRDMAHTDKLVRRMCALKDPGDPLYAELQEQLNDSDNAQQLNLSGHTAAQLRTLCLGLSVCANPSAGMRFGKQHAKASEALQGITDKLMRLVALAGLPDAGKSISVVLDIMNWITRGSKAGLLVASPAIKAMVPRFLDAFLTWAPTPPAEPAANDTGSVPGRRSAEDVPQSDREPHQIGKCAAQVMPIHQKGLIELDQAGCAKLRQLALNLCLDACLKQVAKPPTQGVAVINLSNMIKDGIEAGLISLAEPRLPAILKGLLDLIGKLPASEMLKDGGRTLSNAGNFLRVLIERHLKEPGTFPAQARTAFNLACSHVVACTNAAANLPQQSTTNLLSFMKALDKWIALPELAKLEAWNSLQSGALDAVRKLVNRAIALRGAAFTAQETLGGLLSALAYFQERRLDFTDTLPEFVRELMDSVAAIPQAKWGREGRGLVLQAMEVMVNMEVLAIDDMQDALGELLGPCRTRSGVYALKDLSVAVNRLGPVREVVVALPPQTAPALQSVPPSLPSPLSVLPVAPPPRPGFTDIKEAPIAPVAEKKATAKNTGTRTATTSGTASTSAISTSNIGPSKISTSNTSTSNASSSTSNINTSNINKSKSGNPDPSLTRDKSDKDAFVPAKRTARSNRPAQISAMVITAPVLGARSTVASREKPVPAQARADTQITKPASAFSQGNDGSSTASASAKGKKDIKPESAKPSVATGPKPKTGDAKPAAASAAQKSGGIPPKQKWFDQLVTGSVSLAKLQRLAQDNPELLNAKDKTGHTAIFYAVTRGKPDVVNWLMEHEGHRLEGAAKPFLNTLFSAVKPDSPQVVMEALPAFLRHASGGRYIRDPADLEQSCFTWARKQPWLAPTLQSAGVNIYPAPNALRAANAVPASNVVPVSSTSSVSKTLPISKAMLDSALDANSKPGRKRADQLSLAVLKGPDAVREHLAAFPHPGPEILKAGGAALQVALFEGKEDEALVLMEHWNGVFIDQVLIHTPANPLYIALRGNRIDLITRLIKHGNGKLLRTESIRVACPVVEAIRLGKAAYVRMLLDAMDDDMVAAARLAGYNALALAAYEGNEEIARMILHRAPAMANERNDEGKTPLDIARDYQHAGVIALLTQHAEKPASAAVAPIDKVSPSGSMEAGTKKINMRKLILAGDMDALRMRLAEHPDSNEEMLNDCADSLVLALTIGDTEMVKDLLAYRAGAVLDRMCTRSMNPLMIAPNIAAKKLRMLLDHQHGKLLDPDASGNNVLQKAIVADHLASAAVLAREIDEARLAWANPRGENALTLAAMSSNLEGAEAVARILFARKPALATQPDVDGKTPLDHAKALNNVALVRLFTSQ